MLEPYPSEKYEFVSWDHDIPNIEKKTCSKPPTSFFDSQLTLKKAWYSPSSSLVAIHCTGRPSTEHCKPCSASCWQNRPWATRLRDVMGIKSIDKLAKLHGIRGMVIDHIDPWIYGMMSIPYRKSGMRVVF